MMKAVALLTVQLILAAGCSSTIVHTEGVRPDKGLVSSLQPGVTTKDSVLKLFGEATEASSENGEERLVYVFKEKKTPAYLGGLIEDEARSNVTTTTLELTIRNGVVFSYRFLNKEE